VPVEVKLKKIEKEVKLLKSAANCLKTRPIVGISATILSDVSYFALVFSWILASLGKRDSHSLSRLLRQAMFDEWG
jgi:hypothetical protein